MMIAKKIVVKGIVQGVGFRPFIYKNATKNNLKGFVNNTSKGVFIEVEGYEEDITYFIDVNNRRYRYPFTNCTNCGPRFSITKKVPYDRENTTMDVFQMCSECREEYNDPLNRRFHAQPNGCSKCGPRVYICNKEGNKIISNDPIKDIVKEIKNGKIVSICLSNYLG